MIENINNKNLEKKDTLQVNLTKDKCKFFKDPLLDFSFLDALGGSENAIAKFIFELKKYEFRNDKVKNPVWFYFNGVVWEKANDSLNSFLTSVEFLKNFSKAIDIFKYNKKETKRIQKIIKNLHCKNFQDGVLTQCSRIFFENFPDFLKSLDRKNICTFSNGVFDLNTLIFRNAKFYEYSTLSTKIEYYLYDSQQKDIQFVMKFFQDILPDESVRNYLLTVLSTCLSLDNNYKKFYLMTGDGKNGKSLLIKLLKHSLGEYFGTCNSRVITELEKNANTLNKSLDSNRNKRLIIFNEFGYRDIIKIHIMKKFIEGDLILTRDKNGKYIQFEPAYKCFLVCKTMPTLSEKSQSETWRIRVINFPIKFVDNPDPNNPNEKQINSELFLKLETCASAFLSILVEYYKKYKTDGFKEPNSVLGTVKYQEENDKIKYFIDEFIKIERDAIIQPMTLYLNFEKWFKQQYKEVPVEKNTFQDYVEKIVFNDKKPKSNRNTDPKTKHMKPFIYGWKGYELTNPFLQS